jgi:imidazolonepropionase-like amidohydrolase
MRKTVASLFLLLLLAPPSAQSKLNSAPSGALVFTHVTVIDATGSPAKTDMTVVIIRDRITEIGRAPDVRTPGDAQVVNATGKFLIPGLWDMHVHWYLKDYLPLFIANGVTGVRMMWGMPMHHQWRKEIDGGTLLGPRLFIASSIIDGPNPVWPNSVSVSNDAEARQAVKNARNGGADFIKVYSRLPREAFFAIADESKKLGLTFAGHVPQSVTVAEASDAGQKSIEHLTSILTACSGREEEVRKMSDADRVTQPGRLPDPGRGRAQTRMVLDSFNAEKAAVVFERFKRNRTWQCPTLTVLRNMAFLDDPTIRSDPRLKYMPQSVRGSWDPTKDFRFRNRTAEDYELSRLGLKKQFELVGAMRGAGVEFLAGTDALNPFCFPGFSLHDELALLVGAGLSTMEALQAATVNPARFMGKENEIARLRKVSWLTLCCLKRIHSKTSAIPKGSMQWWFAASWSPNLK